MGVPERVKGLYRAATAPQQPISLQDKAWERRNMWWVVVRWGARSLDRWNTAWCTWSRWRLRGAWRGEGWLGARTDPLKLRLQRRLKELHEVRAALTSGQLLRILVCS